MKPLIIRGCSVATREGLWRAAGPDIVTEEPRRLASAAESLRVLCSRYACHDSCGGGEL